MVAVKRSVSFNPAVWRQAEQSAKEAGRSVSSLVNDAVAESLALERGLAAMEQWQDENGQFADAEMAAADREIDTALAAGSVTPQQRPRRSA